jgi:hypothetical protein
MADIRMSAPPPVISVLANGKSTFLNDWILRAVLIGLRALQGREIRISSPASTTSIPRRA